ncbi:predicted protein [Streptomyces sviceus ATCC 29083]|uniref:Uncharacterized protein n=2 Tax=Streptomyces TaxID=1883 RepID=D6XAV2_STRX2|nr:predicted protein [Streptomyces sviceus ATCC 29083]
MTARVRRRCQLRGFRRPVHGGGAPDGANGRTGRRGISPAQVTYGVDMGVFARLLRRSKATEEASTAETQADILTAEPAAEAAAEAKGSTDAEADAGAGTEVGTEAAAGTGTEVEGDARAEVEVTETATAEGTDGPTATEAVEDAAAEGVEIPKQQSAEATADHETGEGART